MLLRTASVLATLLFSTLAFANLLAIPVAAGDDVSVHCEKVGRSEINKVLGAAPVPMTAEEMGEESTPYCLWATENRYRSLKVQVWSAAELQILGVADAPSYFKQLLDGYANHKNLTKLTDVADSAFAIEDKTGRGGKKIFGSVVILKGLRVLVFDYVNIPADRAVSFAIAAAEKI